MKEIKNFALNAWADSTNAHTPSTTDANDQRQQLLLLIGHLVERRLNIAEDYDAWIKAGFAIADSLGEEGRTHFHRLSSLSSKYDRTDCDRKYSSLLRSDKGGITAGTLFQMAKEAGIDLAEIGRQSAKSAKAPLGTIPQKPQKSTKSDISEPQVTDGTMALLALSASSPTFSDKLQPEILPSVMHPLAASQDSPSTKDMLLLAYLNLASILISDGLYGIYDRRKVYAPLYNLVWGRFASGKGILEMLKKMMQPLRAEMRQAHEQQMADYYTEKAAWEAEDKSQRGPEPQEPKPCTPLISANSSASALYRALDANGGWGAIFETEADTLTNMLSKSEYGDYSDLLRKAHHHETIAMVRVSDRVNIEIEQPRLAVLLTCTPSQIPQLLPANNVANGLASRFLFYGLHDAKVEFRDVFAGADEPLEDIYLGLGQQIMPLYHELQSRKDHPIQFVLSDTQRNAFVANFNEMLTEQFSMLGDGIQGFIFRIALECFRYAMILSALRRLSQWNGQGPIFDPDEQALVCDDRDFSTAIAIIDCLINHTARVYSVLGSSSEDPFAHAADKPSDTLRRFYAMLPSNEPFTTAQAIQAASAAGISKRNAQRLLGEMHSKYGAIVRRRQGQYIKNSPQNE